MNKSVVRAIQPSSIHPSVRTLGFSLKHSFYLNKGYSMIREESIEVDDEVVEDCGCCLFFVCVGGGVWSAK